MGNEQSSGGRGLTDSSSVLKDCVIDADPIINDEHWSLHHAQLHSTPMSVFISKDNDGSLENLAKVILDTNLIKCGEKSRYLVWSFAL